MEMLTEMMDSILLMMVKVMIFSVQDNYKDFDVNVSILAVI